MTPGDERPRGELSYFPGELPESPQMKPSLWMLVWNPSPAPSNLSFQSGILISALPARAPGREGPAFPNT